MPETKNCETCAHGKFDEIWGEYKCLKLDRRIYDVRARINCALWEKGAKKEDINDAVDVDG